MPGSLLTAANDTVVPKAIQPEVTHLFVRAGLQGNWSFMSGVAAHTQSLYPIFLNKSFLA